jgi:hypothetical protein
MSFAIALTVHRASLRATKRRESTDQWSGECGLAAGRTGPSTDLSPPADMLATGVRAGPRPDFDSGALFAGGDTGDRDRGHGPRP